jgi:DNA-binding transcriptional regulator YiaG
MAKHDYAPRFVSIGSFDRRWHALGLDDEDLRSLEIAMSEKSDLEALGPRVREIVGELHELCDAVDAGSSLDEVAKVRTISIDTEPPVVSPGDVCAVRESLGLNQVMFADFLGVGLSTVRRWEKGQLIPSVIARRLLDEVRDDPGHWRKKLCR